MGLPPPLAEKIDNLYPQSDGTIHFAAAVGDEITFKIIESKESRSIGTSYELVYDVFMDPPKAEGMDQGLFDDYITNVNNISDEVIIGWNVFNWTGWTFFDLTLVKRWPPKCVRVGHNHYKVTISYAPLNIINFQIAPTRAKMMFSRETTAWVANEGGGAWNKVDESTIGVFQQVALMAIDTDSSGKIQGIDVGEPSFSWTERWVWGPHENLVGDESSSWEHYFLVMTDLAYTVNEHKFRGCEEGTVLFRGGAGRNIGPMVWEIDYEFSYRPKREKQEFGLVDLEIPEARQSGWLFVDVVCPEGGEEVTLHNRKFKLQFPEIVKLHKVYPVRDFAPLKLLPEISLGTAQPFRYIENLPKLDFEATCPVIGI